MEASLTREPELKGGGEDMMLSDPMFSQADRLEMASDAIKFRNKVIENLRAQLAAREETTASLRQALEIIERWFGEFPKTGRTWDDGTEMPYSACFGSNGERDYMRAVARAALEPKE